MVQRANRVGVDRDVLRRPGQALTGSVGVGTTTIARMGVERDSLRGPGAAQSGRVGASTSLRGDVGVDREFLRAPGVSHSGRASSGALYYVVAPAVPGEPLVPILDSGTVIAANQTAYLPIGMSTESHRVPLPACSVVEVEFYSTAAPGAGETFTYTMRKTPFGSDIGSDTAITATISGTSKEATASGSVAFAKQEKVTIKLVTSLNAAECFHYAVVKLSFS